MSRDSPTRAIVVVFCVALACSLMVSTAAIVLRPLQARNELIRKSRNVVGLTGLVAADGRLTDERVLEISEALDLRAVDLESGRFAPDIDPLTFDARAALRDPQLSTQIPAQLDVARIGRRARYQVAYLVWQDDALDRIILPIHGQGMWSTMRGFIAIEEDLETIAGVTFYEQEETAGLGDQIMRKSWQAKWEGQRLYDDSGEVRFRVAAGPAPEGAEYAVDGLTGATITGDGVTNLVRYWFGPHGYGPFLERLREHPPQAPDDGGSNS